jgi:hypothetical protein
MASSARGDWVSARKRLEKGLIRRDAAFNIEQHAHDQAEEDAHRKPWQLLHEARQLYIFWQELFWARSRMEGEGSLPPWLADEIANRCPGFPHFLNRTRPLAAEPRMTSLNLEKSLLYLS